MGSKTQSWALCPMIYNHPRPIVLGHRIVYIHCGAVTAPWLLRYPRSPKRAFHVSPCFLYYSEAQFGLSPIGWELQSCDGFINILWPNIFLLVCVIFLLCDPGWYVHKSRINGMKTHTHTHCRYWATST